MWLTSEFSVLEFFQRNSLIDFHVLLKMTVQSQLERCRKEKKIIIVWWPKEEEMLSEKKGHTR